MTACDLAPVAAELEEALIAGLRVTPRPIAPELADAAGAWKGAPVALRVRAFAGPRIRYARIVSIAGAGLDILNVLALADARWPLPILGIDFVSLGTGTMIAAADLSPIAAGERLRNRQAAAVAARLAVRPPLPSAGTLPDWAAAWFSPHALFTRVSLDRLDDVTDHLIDLVDVFTALAHATPPDPAGAAFIAGRQQAYCAAHLADDRGLQLTRKLFDAGIAERLLSGVLFPTRGTAWI